MAGRLTGGTPETLFGMMIFYVLRGAGIGTIAGAALGTSIGDALVWLMRKEQRESATARHCARATRRMKTPLIKAKDDLVRKSRSQGLACRTTLSPQKEAPNG